MNFNFSEIDISALITTIIPLLVGGLSSAFKDKIVSKANFKESVDFLSIQLLEKISEPFSNMILPLYEAEYEFNSSVETIKEKLNKYIKEEIRLTKIILKLEHIYKRLCSYYEYLFYSTLFALILVMLIFLNIDASILVVGSIVLLFIQIISLIGIKNSERKLEQYEEQVK